jgi:L-seryl-tRNA(Ser) seleniumtransferase
MKRRDLLKFFSITPLTGALAAAFPFGSVQAAPNRARRDVLKELGLRTFINAAGTYTTMTASLMHDEVMDVITYHPKNLSCSMKCRTR